MCMSVVDVTRPMDYQAMSVYIRKLKAAYDFLEVQSIGRTALGRELPCLRLGTGDHAVLYVGAHHASEWITALLMMRFIEDYCSHFSVGKPMVGYDLTYIFNTRSIYILPMLNPDGVDLAVNGLREDHPLFERLLRQNRGGDFTHWQANARGVDLNHNYNAMWDIAKLMERELSIFEGGPTRYGGEYPESEEETSALCRFVRANDIRLTIAFHSQGEVIYWEYADKTPKAS